WRVAPGKAAPVASVAIPAKLPRKVCAKTPVARNTTSEKRVKIMCVSPCCCKYIPNEILLDRVTALYARYYSDRHPARHDRDRSQQTQLLSVPLLSRRTLAWRARSLPVALLVYSCHPLNFT